MAANGTNGVNGVKAENGKGDVEAPTAAAAVDSGKAVDFAKITIAEAFKTLKATEEGLDSAEVKRRLDQYGYNKLPESTRIPFLVFLGYLWNPLSWAMEVAALLAIILLDYADFALIVALLLVNATISFVEESNADKAIKALTAALAPKARVKRDGKVSTVEAKELVPGDIIIVMFGNIVPADIKLLGKENDNTETPMQIDQAALTGESLPAKKFSGHVAFSGSTVKQGEKEALVYATGENTFFGRAAALISGTHNVANLQKIMTRIGGTCLITIGVWCVIELAVQFGHYKHVCRMGAEGCPTLTNMLVIIVGGIPIAMPTVLSVTLALGAYKLAKEGAIVARMSAVEEMAGMDILCSDKTGTLTLNQLSVDKPTCMVVGPEGRTLDEVLKWGALSANIVSEEPIDVVLHEAYDDHEHLWNDYKLQKFVPFNPTDKYTIATVKDNKTGECTRIMKGAPQVVLKKSYNYAEIGDAVHNKITEFAGRGFRALGVATAPDDGTAVESARWDFQVLLPLFDPPRHDTKETIERCIEKGIQVKMVTGDQLLIGKETAKQLGMGTNMYTTEVLLNAKEGKGQLPPEMAHVKDVDELVEHADGFAEVFPEHKFEIVNILKGRKHIVGMTGDGVNDAPALKKADVGIAVDGATDAARGAADIVLTRPGLSVIVSAIIGARKIFQRMTTYSKYTVAMTFRICFTFGLLTVIYDWYFPTILIVMLAVFNDGAMIALSKDRVVSSPVPNTWNLRNIFTVGIVYGLYLTLSSWVLYYVATHMTFFTDKCHLADLNTTDEVLRPYCQGLITKLGLTPDAPVTSVYPGQDGKDANLQGVTALDQCITEQVYVRDGITRSLLYNQVSISGQALVFVVRTSSWSIMSRAGLYTYVAFFAAQVGSTLIAAIGFAAYTHPRDPWSFNGPAKFTQLSNGHGPAFFGNSVVPIHGTEGEFTASVIGCTYYVIVAWIWSLIWYIGLDPIKWAMMYILNEDGWRNKKAFHAEKKAAIKAKPDEPAGVAGFERVSYSNPLGRRSVTAAAQRPNFLERASVVMVDDSGLTRAPADKLDHKSLTPKEP
ncbi:hypothetical protein WJX75_000844 [Coccomyxa subellipsoidea]|uniref:Plasma membrane ATPase n=1 Tax=Coccomyxa subellipsoidea TaxID=248742 RepID=A0ABR2YH36_9CHLO